MNCEHTAKTWLDKNINPLPKISRWIFNLSKQIKSSQNHSSTESLNIAIKHLDNHHIETRLSAIYDLEQIAQNNPQLHWEIMEMLTKFVRNHAPLRRESENQSENQSQPSAIVPEDIQAALTVISRRDIKQEKENEQLDLSHTDMRGVNLCEAQLKQTNLYQANLCGADLRGANLSGAILTAANLKGANLTGANLAQAILSAANLEQANLTGANLHRANLYLAKLHGAILDQAILHQANLRESQLSEIET